MSRTPQSSSNKGCGKAGQLTGSMGLKCGGSGAGGCQAGGEYEGCGGIHGGGAGGYSRVWRRVWWDVQGGRTDVWRLMDVRADGTLPQPPPLRRPTEEEGLGCVFEVGDVAVVAAVELMSGGVNWGWRALVPGPRRRGLSDGEEVVRGLKGRKRERGTTRAAASSKKRHPMALPVDAVESARTNQFALTMRGLGNTVVGAACRRGLHKFVGVEERVLRIFKSSVSAGNTADQRRAGGPRRREGRWPP